MFNLLSTSTSVLDRLSTFFASSGIAGMQWGNLAMICVAILLLYLAIRHKFEPLLLMTIAFGMLLTNLPGANMYHAASTRRRWRSGSTLNSWLWTHRKSLDLMCSFKMNAWKQTESSRRRTLVTPGGSTTNHNLLVVDIQMPLQWREQYSIRFIFFSYTYVLFHWRERISTGERK